jgi:hypothetical protein
MVHLFVLLHVCDDANAHSKGQKLGYLRQLRQRGASRPDCCDWTTRCGHRVHYTEAKYEARPAFASM